MVQSTPNYQTVDQISDEMELVKAAQTNPRQFAPLYNKYYKRIVTFVYHRVENKDDAFEITSQVFYRALENLSKYKSLGLPFSSWLFRIASNEVNQFYRKTKVARVIDIDMEASQHLISSIEEIKPDIEDKHLFASLQELSEEEMELIDMRFFEQRSFKEISDITGNNESACKMRVYRILEKLKSKLIKVVK